MSAEIGRPAVASIDATLPSGVIFTYQNATTTGPHFAYTWPIVERVIRSHAFSEKRAFEVGCGQGAASNRLGREFGFSMTAIDPSESGIAVARKAFPEHNFYQLSSDDDLAGRFGTFPLVVSVEVIPCVLNPQLFAKRVFELLEPGGVAIISAPYHGYIKNLLLSLANRWDKHMDPFFPGAWTRFFSERTFRRLWVEAGFRNIKIHRAGRFRAVAHSMVVELQKD